MTTLTKVQQALEQRQTPLQVFLRNDDAADDEPRLRQLIALCARRSVPLSLAVVPGQLTERGIRLLNPSDRLIELHQHGWRHTNHETIGRKCEFGASRDYQSQLADLAAGQARMTDAFGERWFPAFTPPWNRCTAITAQALVDLGYCALSREASQSSFNLKQLPEFPVTLDLFRWRGGASLRAVNELNEELAGQISDAHCLGIMLHHQVMEDDAFALLDQWLSVLQSSPHVQFHTLQSLLKAQ